MFGHWAENPTVQHQKSDDLSSFCSDRISQVIETTMNSTLHQNILEINVKAFKTRQTQDLVALQQYLNRPMYKQVSSSINELKQCYKEKKQTYKNYSENIKLCVSKIQGVLTFSHLSLMAYFLGNDV